MTRLLLITTSYPDATANGREAAGSFVADFAEQLARRIDVVVLAPGAVGSREETNNPRVHRFAAPHGPLSLLSAANPLHWQAIWNVLRAGTNVARQLAESHHFDHVLALWALPSGYWARQLNRRQGIPYSIWALGSDIWSLSKVPLVRDVLRTVLRDSELRFADGFLLSEAVENLAGKRCHFLPSLRRLSPPHRKQLRDRPPFRLAFLGRWHPNKGIDLMLESLALLHDDDWARIDAIKIAGGGPLESLVRERGTVLADAGRPVSVLGYLDKQHATELLAWADYLIIPSRIESIPVIFSDALQSDCPVISTPVGDLQRLLERYRAGVLAQSATAPAIAVAIRTALASAPLSFASGLHQAQSQFSLPAACERFLSLARLAPYDAPHESVSIQS
jgi:glycosyltransferase involved in cell wall biosynthesis